MRARSDRAHTRQHVSEAPSQSSAADKIAQLELERLRLIDARDNAARRIRFAALVLRMEDPLGAEDDGALIMDSLSEYLDWAVSDMEQTDRRDKRPTLTEGGAR